MARTGAGLLLAVTLLLWAAGAVAQVDADTEAAGRVVIVTSPDGREKA